MHVVKTHLDADGCWLWCFKGLIVPLPSSRQDLFLENLYRQLDDTGLSKNTYVVVVGDHGEVSCGLCMPAFFNHSSMLTPGGTVVEGARCPTLEGLG